MKQYRQVFIIFFRFFFWSLLMGEPHPGPRSCKPRPIVRLKTLSVILGFGTSFKTNAAVYIESPLYAQLFSWLSLCRAQLSAPAFFAFLFSVRGLSPKNPLLSLTSSQRSLTRSHLTRSHSRLPRTSHPSSASLYYDPGTCHALWQKRLPLYAYVY